MFSCYALGCPHTALWNTPQLCIHVHAFHGPNSIYIFAQHAINQFHLTPTLVCICTRMAVGNVTLILRTILMVLMTILMTGSFELDVFFTTTQLHVLMLEHIFVSTLGGTVSICYIYMYIQRTSLVHVHVVQNHTPELPKQAIKPLCRWCVYELKSVGGILCNEYTPGPVTSFLCIPKSCMMMY